MQPASSAHTSPSSVSLCLLVLICTWCCRGSIRDHQIPLVGTVRSGYIKEIRRDQPLERDRLWLTSSETGVGPHWKNKGEITIHKTFIFHRGVSLNSFKLPPSPTQSAQTTQHQQKTYDIRLGILGLNRSTKSHEGHNSKASDLVALCHKVFKCGNLLKARTKRELEMYGIWLRCYELVEKLLKPSEVFCIL